VPAGSYLITGRVNVANSDPQPRDAWCRLSVPDFSLDNAGPQDQQRLAPSGSAGHENSFKLQDSATFNFDTPISKTCASDNARTFFPRLAAIKVGAMH
jgi:hypothetical protein